MKNILFFLAALLSIHFAQAQTVDEIVGNHVAAIGGSENLDKMENAVMEGSTSVQGAMTEIRITAIQHKLVRHDILVMGMKNFDFTTDKEGWIFMPIQGMQKPEPKTAEEVKENLPALDLTGSLYNYAAKGNKVELLGKENVGSAGCYKLKVILASGKEEMYFIDSSTYLVVRSTSKRKRNGQEVETNTDLSDYKDVDGIKMPFSITQPFGVFTFSSIKINQAIGDEVYKHE